MMYTHRFRVDAPLEAVAEFHSHSAAMAAITPPPIVVQVHHAPERLAEGDGMDFTLWFGPLPLRWQVVFEDVGPDGFVDRMVRGPLARWRHHHRFVALGPDATEVIDEIDLAPRRHPLWLPVGLFMRANLPVLFAYRAWRTRRLLARGAGQPSSPRLLAAAGLAAATLLGWLGLKRGRERRDK